MKALSILLALVAVLSAQEFQYDVFHPHAHKGCKGVLRVTAKGLSYEETDHKRMPPHVFRWEFAGIQQFELGSNRIRILGYKDRKSRLGEDEHTEFQPLGDLSFDPIYVALRDRLDQRLVAELADAEVRPLWDVPVKRLHAIQGSEGVLVVGEERIVYRSAEAGESRTWRLKDIESIRSSGPFDLTLTTYERARARYGGLKDFHFQLKQKLDEDRYNDLWRRLNITKGVRPLQ